MNSFTVKHRDSTRQSQEDPNLKNSYNTKSTILAEQYYEDDDQKDQSIQKSFSTQSIAQKQKCTSPLNKPQDSQLQKYQESRSLKKQQNNSNLDISISSGINVRYDHHGKPIFSQVSKQSASFSLSLISENVTKQSYNKTLMPPVPEKVNKLILNIPLSTSEKKIRKPNIKQKEQVARTDRIIHNSSFNSNSKHQNSVKLSGQRVLNSSHSKIDFSNKEQNEVISYKVQLTHQAQLPPKNIVIKNNEQQKITNLQQRVTKADIDKKLKPKLEGISKFPFKQQLFQRFKNETTEMDQHQIQSNSLDRSQVNLDSIVEEMKYKDSVAQKIFKNHSMKQVSKENGFQKNSNMFPQLKPHVPMLQRPQGLSNIEDSQANQLAFQSQVTIDIDDSIEVVDEFAPTEYQTINVDSTDKDSVEISNQQFNSQYATEQLVTKYQRENIDFKQDQFATFSQLSNNKKEQKDQKQLNINIQENNDKMSTLKLIIQQNSPTTKNKLNLDGSKHEEDITMSPSQLSLSFVGAEEEYDDSPVNEENQTDVPQTDFTNEVESTSICRGDYEYNSKVISDKHMTLQVKDFNASEGDGLPHAPRVSQPTTSMKNSIVHSAQSQNSRRSSRNEYAFPTLQQKVQQFWQADDNLNQNPYQLKVKPSLTLGDQADNYVGFQSGVSGIVGEEVSAQQIKNKYSVIEVSLNSAHKKNKSIFANGMSQANQLSHTSSKDLFMEPISSISQFQNEVYNPKKRKYSSNKNQTTEEAIDQRFFSNDNAFMDQWMDAVVVTKESIFERTMQEKKLKEQADHHLRYYKPTKMMDLHVGDVDHEPRTPKSPKAKVEDLITKQDKYFEIVKNSELRQQASRYKKEQLIAYKFQKNQ